MHRLAGIVLLFFLFATASIAGNEAIVGQWTVQSGDARVELSAADNGTMEGKIVWLREPVYPKDDPDAGQPKRDRNNPDESKRNDPTIGLKLLHGFSYEGENLWKGGKIYDPKNGKTYSCKLTLTDSSTLKVRGYIGVSLLGRTDVWKRYLEDTK